MLRPEGERRSNKENGEGEERGHCNKNTKVTSGGPPTTSKWRLSER